MRMQEEFPRLQVESVACEQGIGMFRHARTLGANRSETAMRYDKGLDIASATYRS